jgi:hypothetical protein
VRHLRSELCAEHLPPYRTVDGDEHPWQKSPSGTDATLHRFIVARKGDVFAAKKQFIENLHWRSRVFPIPREGLTAQLLDEDLRFRTLRPDTDGCPVLLVNFLFGEFETHEISQLALVQASIRFFEEAIDSMEERGVHQMCHCFRQSTTCCLGTCDGQSLSEQLSRKVESGSCLSGPIFFCFFGPSSHVVRGREHSIQSRHGNG